MIPLLLFLAAFSLAVFLFMQQAKFGKPPQAVRLEQLKKSRNYKAGKFQNQNYTPNLTEGATYFSVLKEFIFNRNKRSKPQTTLPSVKTNLHNLPKDKNVLVWFGHSSYFMQVDGKKILVDPVFSGSASPIRFTTRSFDGTDIYKAEDIPEIDFLFISHDHWDHLDYETVIKLRPKIKMIITGLGTAEHLVYWGFDKNIIHEKDWNEELILADGFVVNTTSARHFSGRGLKRNQALWISFVLKTPNFNIYIGGDSGYDTHFKTIGDTYGPFDIAILECGQYNRSWKHIHMMPEELILAGEDLQAKKILPVHWAKFALAQHDWDEPILRLKAESERKNFPLLHSMIGEEVNLNNEHQFFSEWWLELK